MPAKKSNPKLNAKTKTGAQPERALETAKRAAAAAPKTKPAAAKAKPVASKAKPAALKAKPAITKAKPMVALGEGSKAPDFSLPDDTGSIVSSASLAGKPYVLYFYPKDDTPGCTQEACDFRDNLSAFKGQKLRVIGVSPDDPTRHAKFKQKYGLTFTLLSDTDKTLANAYGVWVEKQNYGRSYMGVERSTFLIDKHGVIKKSWRKVRVPGHVAAVLAST